MMPLVVFDNPKQCDFCKYHTFTEGSLTPHKCTHPLITGTDMEEITIDVYLFVGQMGCGSFEENLVELERKVKKG
jgi:predicted peroxiredoxin